MTDPKTYLDKAEEKMEMAVEYLDESLAHIRAGKANPKILDGIRVDYYGSAAPISNVANVAVHVLTDFLKNIERHILSLPHFGHSCRTNIKLRSQILLEHFLID